MGEILNLIESVSGGFPSYFFIDGYYYTENEELNELIGWLVVLGLTAL